MKASSVCSVAYCGRPVNARGWCSGHYRRWKLHGDVGATSPLAVRPIMALPDRFWTKVDQSTSDGCWPWLGYCAPSGYAYFDFQGHNRKAHRVAWFLTHGQWPDEDLDHTCHNGSGCPGGPTCPHRRCVRPDHLEDVPARVNTLRGNTPAAINAAKTHCPQGHPYSGVSKTGHRICHACGAASSRRYAERKRVLA